MVLFQAHKWELFKTLLVISLIYPSYPHCPACYGRFCLDLPGTQDPRQLKYPGEGVAPQSFQRGTVPQSKLTDTSAELAASKGALAAPDVVLCESSNLWIPKSQHIRKTCRKGRLCSFWNRSLCEIFCWYSSRKIWQGHLGLIFFFRDAFCQSKRWWSKGKQN